MNHDLSFYAFNQYGGDAKLYNGIFDLEEEVERLQKAIAAPKPSPPPRIERTGTSDKPWYIVRGTGYGAFDDYWRDGDGWVCEKPSRYATEEEAQRALEVAMGGAA